jgi:hypothetical protein
MQLYTEWLKFGAPVPVLASAMAESDDAFNAGVEAFTESQRDLEDEILASDDALAKEAVLAILGLESGRLDHHDYLYLRLDELMGRHVEGISRNQTILGVIKRRAAEIRAAEDTEANQ